MASVSARLLAVGLVLLVSCLCTVVFQPVFSSFPIIPAIRSPHVHLFLPVARLPRTTVQLPFSAPLRLDARAGPHTTVSSLIYPSRSAPPALAAPHTPPAPERRWPRAPPSPRVAAPQHTPAPAALPLPLPLLDLATTRRGSRGRPRCLGAGRLCGHARASARARRYIYTPC